MEMLNKPFEVKSVIQGFQNRLSDLVEIFSEATNFGYIDHFIHFDDVIAVSGVSKASAMRRYHSLGEDMKRSLAVCKYHPGLQCTMIEQDLGFLLYLTWLDIPEPLEEKTEESKGVSDAKELMDIEDEESIPPQSEEQALVEKFDPAVFRSETSTKIEDDSLAQDSEDDERNALKLLPIFPTYCFNEREYLLLNDIQHLFDLREDFALAVLAGWGELDDGFVDSNPCPLAVLDTKGEDFLDKEKAAMLCMEMFETYENKVFPVRRSLWRSKRSLPYLRWAIQKESLSQALQRWMKPKALLTFSVQLCMILMKSHR